MLNWFVLRPVFQIALDVSRDEAIERLASEYQQRAQPKLFLVHGEYGELNLPVAEHRLWSPHLSFYVTQEQDRVLLRGRFAPRIDIWTFVWVLYLAMAFTAFFSLTMEISLRAIGESGWWHWLAIAALLAIVLIYTVAHVGQQWSADQMHQLRDQLHQILEKLKLTQPQNLN